MCSVSIAKDGNVLSQRELIEEKSHAKKLTEFIDEMLKEQHLELKDLHAVAVSKGPGSYTGLRIGVSTAKGICYGANIPLLAIDTLTIICNQVLLKQDRETCTILKNPSAIVCSMIDARRMEVYYALFNNLGVARTKPAAIILDQQTFIPLLEKGPVIFAGSGMYKCKNLLNHPNAIFIDHIYPSAVSMASQSFKAYQNKEMVNLAYFEPFYLKDFIGTKPKKKLPV